MRYTYAFKGALSDLVTHLAAGMELGEWRVSLQEEYPDSPDAAASIKPIYGRKYADLYLSQGFFDFPIQDQEHYLIHEMCHLHSDGIDSLIVNDLEILMGRPAFTMFSSAYRIAMETMTDQLAYAFRDFFAEVPRYRTLINNLEIAEQGFLPPPKEGSLPKG